MTFGFITSIFLLIAGFFLLIKGADYMVQGASSVAARMKISPLVIGLTVVAFGTSAPELIVNMVSALQGANQVAIGNILGSNMANILLVLGAAAIIRTLTVHRQTITKEIPFSLLAAIVVLITASDIFLDGLSGNLISRSDGLIFILFFIIFLYYSYGAGRMLPQEERVPRTLSRTKSTLFIIGGLIALFIGGRVIVESAVHIALMFNVSQNIIGLTIVALGTSLPELVTSLVAVRKGEVDLAIGNVVGSNIFNIFLVLGLTATIAPISFDSGSFLDAAIVIAASLALFGFLFVGAKQRLGRLAGIIFVGIYLGYIAFRVIEDVL